jgi:6-phosphogluconolactonase (cycloisomerase 2 family)
MSSSGNLTLGDVVSTPLLTPFSAAVDPSGHFVYVSLIIDGPVVLSEYSLSSDGTLVPLAPSSVTAPEGARSLALSAQGFLYTLNQGGTVTAFWIDESTGQLANAGSFATGTGSGSSPISIAFDPSGAYAYVVNYADNSVTQFTVNGTSGALSMNGPDVPTGQGPVQVAVDPSGKFAFVLNETDGTISQFLISNTGRLTANGIYSVGVAYGPHQFVLAQR